MANSELYDKNFQIPSNIINYIQTKLIANPQGNGIKRAKNIVKNRYMTYQGLKRLKNFFDYFNPQTQNKVQYELAGGELMKSFVDRILNSERDAVKRGDEIKRDVSVDSNLGIKPFKSKTKLNEINNKINKNVTIIIVNEENKILLLKRSDYPDQWMPSKWALVGGAVDVNEKPEEAIKREIIEETGLEIDEIMNTFTIKKNVDDSIEFVYVCKYSGDSSEIDLNEEHSGYGWFSIDEIKELDTVPHIMEYLTLSFKKYD